MKNKESIAIDLDIEESIIASFIQNGSKVLFLNPSSESFMNYIINKKECILSIFQDKPDLDEDFELDGLKVYRGKFSSQFLRFKPNEFDFIVLDNFLEYQQYSYDLLKSIASIFPKIILPITNSALWKRRINFLLSGTLFAGSRKSYENYDFWRLQYPWRWSYKDVLNMCQDLSLRVESALYADKNKNIFRSDDIRNNPNLFSDRIVFLISESRDGILLKKAIV